MRRERGALATAVALIATIGASGCGDRAAARSADPPPTFAADVAPILFENCATCHRPGGPGPFDLLSYEDAKPRAERIAQVTRERFMPPWLPEPGYAEFEGARLLSQEEIGTIQRWVQAGAPEGDPSVAPAPPSARSEWELGPPDLVLEMEEPFPVPPTGDDIFRNFVIPGPVDGTRWVRAVDLRPGDTKAIHHAMIMVDPTPAARTLAAEDERPGFEGMVRGNAEMPVGFLLGWTPGKTPAPEPEGLAWKLEAGTDVVLQLHLRPTGRPESVQARMGLYFAEEPPERRPFTLHLVDMTIDLAPGEEGHEITDSYTLPVDVEALGIYPHAHYLGDRMEVKAELPDGSTRWLLLIEEWDFNWQDSYRYAEPVPLPAGTEVSMRFTYDNSADNPRNPHRPPTRVRYGPESSDEMGDVWIQVLPASEAARERLVRDVARKEIASRVRYWRWKLSSDPTDAEALHGLGFVLQTVGRHEEAADHYRRALDSRPEDALTHYNLAVTLEALGGGRDAVEHYREALRLQPGHADAANNLGRALLGLGRPEEAEGLWRRALEADPRHARAHNNLGNLLRARGRLGEASRHLERAVQLQPDYAEAHVNLGLVHMAAGDPAAGVERFRHASRLAPDDARILTLLAWTLATHADPRIRAPAEAVGAGERAAELTDRRDPTALQALAAAYAAEGRFDAAVAAAERGIEAAASAGAERVAATLRELLALFREERAYTSGAPGGSS